MKPWTFLDKLVWGIARWATRFILPPLISLGITPNQLTVASAIVNFTLAVFCFAQGKYEWNLIGLFFLLLHAYFDFADGDLARATGKTSKVGGWLDARLDVMGAEAVIVGIVVGVVRVNLNLLWLSIAALAVFGRLGVLAVVFDYEKTIYKSPQFWNEFAQDKKMTLVDRLVKEFITLESFPFLFLGTFRYFLPLMVFFGQLKWFVLISAIFNNLRWLIMFWAYAKAQGEQKSRLRVINLLGEYLKK
ncbi:CDP-alcohol phosphatidyltransferase family protein [Candidatus Gottesmanbacteria bacterium]|nr:CDP-alcohol phosphatidyltransferase family protein [Candidatus Gottesmanbacteria bacterium]